MIHRKILTIALAVLALAVAVAAPPALAANAPRHHKAPHRYALKHGHHCRKQYKRVRHGRKVYCVRRKTRAVSKTAPAAPAAQAPIEKVKLKAHLDPTFTRNPLNPFEVTYSYSASASAQAFSTESVALGVEEPTPLPSGVLALYSDGKLECATNVGGSLSGSECPVTYEALGTHRVTTIYSSNELENATETETETIGPLATTTTTDATFVQQPPHEVSMNQWRVGTLGVSVQGSVPGTLSLGCGGEAGCIEPASGIGETPVYVEVGGFDDADEPIFELREPQASGDLVSLDHFAAGTFHVRGTLSPAAGYIPSAATAPVTIVPTLLPVAFPLSVGPTTVTEIP